MLVHDCHGWRPRQPSTRMASWRPRQPIRSRPAGSTHDLSRYRATEMTGLPSVAEAKGEGDALGLSFDHALRHRAVMLVHDCHGWRPRQPSTRMASWRPRQPIRSRPAGSTHDLSRYRATEMTALPSVAEAKGEGDALGLSFDHALRHRAVMLVHDCHGWRPRQPSTRMASWRPRQPIRSRPAGSTHDLSRYRATEMTGLPSVAEA